jgi:hypothetical protein
MTLSVVNCISKLNAQRYQSVGKNNGAAHHSVLATALSRAWEEQGRQQDWGLRAPMKW